MAIYGRELSSPADLSPAALSASTTADAEGGFEFDAIGHGDYFLAVFRGKPASGIRVSGHRGDIRVAGKAVSLPDITVRR